LKGGGTKFWWKNQIHTSIVILYAIGKKSPTSKMPTCGQTSLSFVSTLQTLTLIHLHFDNVHPRGKVLTPKCPHMVLSVFLGANFYHMVTKKKSNGIHIRNFVKWICQSWKFSRKDFIPWNCCIWTIFSSRSLKYNMIKKIQFLADL
jgi:hypothetical protein